MKMFYEKDADVDLIKNKKIAKLLYLVMVVKGMLML